MYAQPSEKTASQIPHSTTMPGLVSFYKDSIGASKKQTQQKSTKKPSQCVSSQSSDERQSRSSRSQFPSSPASQSSLHAGAADQQRTMILQICNIRFFQNGNLINHDDDKLEFSDCISLTFEKQKKESFAQLVQRRPLYTESEVTTE